MKILRIIHSANPKIGGPINGIINSSKFISRDGHKVTHISLDAPADVSGIDLPGEFIALGPSKSGYGFCPNLDQWLTKNLPRFDAVLVHGIWQYHGFAVWRHCRRLGKTAPPYYVYTHGMLDPWFKRTYPLKHLKKWLYWPWGEYRILRDAKAVLFTSEKEKILARKSFWLYRAHERVIGYGTQRPEFSQEQYQAEWSKLCPAKQGARYWLYLGRLHEKKGADLLINAYRALKSIRKSLPDLILAGPEQDTRFTDQLKQMAADDPQIHFVGMLSGAAKWGALANADAMVLPSHQENFGIVVAEAMAMSTPVLISNKVNIWREIEQAKAGIVANDDLSGTQELLSQFLELDQGQRSEMSRAAQKCYEDHFSMERATHDLIQFLQA
ncbi:glycosyltransferase [Cerasicoccus frondis]|uniref:glycosyltransferase n=1 Tax=Cerasicoccus frondis TaxID=490090 RepID=UPI00285251DA|nr:glycosyltransferase [Cerasicoccus frondis]